MSEYYTTDGKAITAGPLDTYKEAETQAKEAGGEFVVKKCFDENQYGAPAQYGYPEPDEWEVKTTKNGKSNLYPFLTESEVCDYE